MILSVAGKGDAPCASIFSAGCSRKPVFWVMLALFLAAAAVRIHNAWVAQPTWGIDPEAHLGYVHFLLEHGRRPEASERHGAHIAPFFYWGVAWLWKVVGVAGVSWGGFERVLMFLQAGINFAGLVAVYMLGRIWFPCSRKVALASFALFAFLPANIRLSMQFSNECMHQTLLLFSVLAASHILLDKQAHMRWFFIYAACILCAVAVKITALPVLVLCTLFLVLRGLKEKKYLATCVLSAVAIIAWGVLMLTHLNPAMASELGTGSAKRTHTDPVGYLTTFDPTVALHPFCPPTIGEMRAQSFWTIFYVGLFGDFEAAYQNHARLQQLPQEKKIRLFSKGMYPGEIPAYLYIARKALAIFSLPCVFVFPIFWVIGIRGLWLTHARSREAFFLPMITLSGLTALICFGFLHPAGGVPVKPIYVMFAMGCAFVPVAKAWSDVSRAFPKAGFATACYFVLWAFLSVACFWV